MSNAKTVMSQAANTWAGPTYIEDVFSTYLYTGNGTTQTITNGIDLAGEGGMVWIKSRNNTTVHYLQDTERGANNVLTTTSTAAQSTLAINFSFTDSGFSQTNNNASFNQSYNYASWTFRKAPRFFDCVTWVGNGQSTQTITHNLGMAPACVIIKATGVAQNWWVYHADRGTGKYLVLNTTAAEVSGSIVTGTSEDDFTVGSTTTSNGYTYVAYLFAHDPLGPSGDGSDGLIACGSYTGNGSLTGPVIDLGWEPQWLLVKRSNVGSNWIVIDNMRGFVAADGNDALLYPNLTNAEASTNYHIQPTPTGFQPVNSTSEVNASGGNYIYIAIRRGPMRQPTSGTEVFAVDTTATAASGSTPSYVSNFPVDMGLYRRRSTTASWLLGTRLLQGTGLNPASTAAAYIDGEEQFDYMIGWKEQASAISDQAGWMFRRAPGFFDVVAYTGDGVAGRTVPHNLGVAPELMIVKRRNGTNNWAVYHTATGATDVLFLNTTAATTSNSFYWNNTDPTADNFILSTGLNTSTYTYIAYLFASCPGVSKVGSFNSATDVNIDCGFTSGARFVLVKKTNDINSWYVVDSVRGIVSSLEPVLELNSTGAEFSSDLIDPYAPGFAVGSNLQNTGTYIYLAIA